MHVPKAALGSPVTVRELSALPASGAGPGKHPPANNGISAGLRAALAGRAPPGGQSFGEARGLVTAEPLFPSDSAGPRGSRGARHSPGPGAENTSRAPSGARCELGPAPRSHGLRGTPRPGRALRPAWR
ncbi:collagen alpha-1(I) chain-like [Dermochelys coriacea]|uniref:collagen alpha-1(I) chain-like n=1 Tax=Dermochelys coriacea TaxID=27794 RepID=UPI001CA97E2B|nr:collagen alpha-1(I) chain-like [Dermochelys coriacea]